MRLRWVLLGLLVVALLVPAVMTTGARLVQPDAGRLVRLVALTPYALGPYVLVLLLLALAVVAGSGRWRRFAAWSAVAVVLLGGLHVWWLSPLYAGSQAAAAEPGPAGEPLTVLAANLQRGGGDPARVMRLVAANGADVLVLSEITPEALAALEEAGVHEVFDSIAGEPAAGVDGTMLFSRYDLADEERLDTVSGGWAVTMSTPQLGPVRFVAVHPSPPFGDAEQWRADHREIFEYVAGVAADDTVLVAGDLNATPDNEPLVRLRDLGLRAAAAVADSGHQPTWPSPVEESLLGVGVPSVLQIDHVLVDPTVAALDTQTATVEGSDHRALVATLAPR